jgi:cytochrome c oxidase subunit 2
MRSSLTALGVLGFAQGATAQARRSWPGEIASDFGWRFDDLFSLITILCSVSFAIVVIMILIPAFRDRARPGHKAEYDHGSSLHDKHLTTVISCVTFVVLDAWVLVIAMRDLREGWWNIPDVEDSSTYTVEVLAQQWAWNFRHPGADGVLGTGDDIIELNNLTVPKDRPVSLQFTSKDVIHSLFVPEMRWKRDVNPGAITKAWFKPIIAGDFTILCAELCGYAHYQMFGTCHVLDAETFEAWANDASELGLAAFDPQDEEAQWAWDWKE